MIPTQFEHVPPPPDCSPARPIFIVGSGVSFSNVTIPDDAYVIAVKGAMFDLHDRADIAFGMDIPRLNNWYDRFDRLPFDVWWSIPYPRELRYISPNLHFVERGRETDIATDPGHLNCGSTSGFGAVNFAVLLTRELNPKPPIYLVGFDYKATNGHWHANPAHNISRTQHATNWVRWAKEFDNLGPQLRKAGYTVYNTSENTAITAFDRGQYEEHHLHRI